MPSLFKERIVFGAETDREDPDIAESFHENTKLQPDLSQSSMIPGEYSAQETQAMLGSGRRYLHSAFVALPEPTASSRNYDDVVLQRRTRREPSPTPMGIAELSYLLHRTAGVTGASADGRRTYRTAPSAGGLYPLELYLGVRSVDGVGAGLYHFSPRRHGLSRLRAGDPTPALLDCCHYKETLERAAVVVVFCAVLQRTVRKYGPRGYRYALLDVGHAAQNLCLASESQDIACMTTCGFFDDRLHDTLGIDGLDEVALYLAYLGPQS